MSRTYTLNATIYGGQSVTRTRDFHNFTSTDRKEVGYHQHGQGYYYQAVALLFDQSTLATLRTKTIESITLTFGSTSFSYAYQVQWGEKETADSTDFTIGEYTLTNVERYATMPSFTFETLPTYGYVFGGYYQTLTWSTISSATLTVVTTETSKTLSYNANGGSGAPSAQTGWSNPNTSVSLTVSSTVPTRTGYTFLRWNTKSDGTGTSYSSGSTISISIDTVLYAIWEAQKSIIANHPNGTIGSSVTVTWTAKGSFQHRITFKLGSSSTTATVNAGTNSYTFTLPTSWLSELPTTTSGTATIVLDTLVNGVSVGTDTATFTASVASSVVPSIGSVTAEKVNSSATVEAWDIYLQNFSQVKLTASTLSAGTGATLASIRFTGQNMDTTLSVSGTSANATSNTITSSGSLTYTVTLTDSRGRTATQTVSISVTAYSPPTVTAFTGYRCDSDGTVNPITGESLKASVSFSYTAVGTNAVTNTLSYKKTTETNWTTAGTDIASGSTTIFATGTADIASTYDVRFTISDSLYNTSTVSITISSVVGIAFGLKNDRARFGGAVRQSGLEVDWNTQFDADVEVKGDLTVNSHPVVLTVNNTAPDADGNVNVSGGGGSYPTQPTFEKVTIQSDLAYPLQITDSNGDNAFRVINYQGACNVSVYDDGTERNFIGDGRFSTYDDTGTEVDRICDDGSFFGSDVTFNGDATYNGYSLGMGALYRGYAKLISTDFDDIVENGIYTLDGTTMANAPSAYTWSVLQVISNPTGYVQQRVIRAYECFSRVKTGNPLAWVSWERWPLRTAYGDLSQTGRNLSASPSTISVASGVWKTVGSITIPSGTWLLLYNIMFANNATGRRGGVMSLTQDSGSTYLLMLSDMKTAVNGGDTFCKALTFVNFTSSTTLYLNAWHNAGSAINVTGRVQAIRIV